MSPVPEASPLDLSVLDPTPVLAARQAATTVVQNSAQSGCAGQYSGGTLAGAILGTFFGTLLILYLFSTVINTNVRRSETVVVEKRRNGSRRHRSHSGSSSVRRPSRVYSTHD